MGAKAPSLLGSDGGTAVSRSLFLIWQNPRSRRFIRIGELSELIDGSYSFAYTDEARDADGFFPLTQFPEIERTYVSPGLPAFFVNRLMSRKRDSFTRYLHALGIDSSELATPMELLARTGDRGPLIRFTLSRIWSRVTMVCSPAGSSPRAFGMSTLTVVV